MTYILLDMMQGTKTAAAAAAAAAADGAAAGASADGRGWLGLQIFFLCEYIHSFIHGHISVQPR